VERGLSDEEHTGSCELQTDGLADRRTDAPAKSIYYSNVNGSKKTPHQFLILEWSKEARIIYGVGLRKKKQESNDPLNLRR